jgi:spore coat protein U-like protein
MPRRTNRSRRRRGRNNNRNNPSGSQRHFNVGPYNQLSNTVMRFGQMIQIASNGSGTAAGNIYCDPTASYANYPEFVNYANSLWSEYRIVRMKVTFFTTLPFSGVEIKGDSFPMGLAPNLRATALIVTPTSINQIIDNAGSKIWNILADTTGRGFSMNMNFNTLNFGSTGTTTGSPDYAGAPGSITYYCTTLPTSIQVANYLQECWYEFRART